MIIYRTFYFLFFFSLSANVYTQIDYDSIAISQGYLIEENFEYDEVELFKEKFNDQTFFSYVDLVFPEDNPEVQELSKEMAESNYGGLIFDRINSYLVEGVTYKFVNYNFDELKNIYLTLRLYTDDNTVNYHQYLLEPSGINEYKITDVYIFQNSQYISETFTKVINLTLERMGADKGYEDTFLNTVVQIRSLMGLGKMKKARKKFYTEIPEEVRTQKEFVYLELELVDKTDDKAIDELLERMHAVAEEGSPSIFLAAIDLHSIRGQYQKVIEAVDSLYEFTSDELLELYKGNAYYELEDYAAAEKSFNLAVEHHPDMAASHNYLIDFYVTRNEIPKALNAVDTMCKYQLIDFKFVEQNYKTTYPEIANTPEYKIWIKGKMDARKVRLDSMRVIMKGDWIFQGTEDFEGNETATTQFPQGDYGNKRPDLYFSGDGSYILRFGEKVYEEGIWDFDFNYNTLDFYVPFDESTKEGKEILNTEPHEVINGRHHRYYSLYYYSIDQEIIKLYDYDDGLNVFKKK